MATSQTAYLPGTHPRARWLRMDAARILKRFFFCERSLIIAQSGWLAGIADFETKLALPQFSWRDAVMAQAFRDRVFELHFPSRLMEVGDDGPLLAVFDEALNAPSAEAFILALARVYKPALLAAYEEYVSLADPLTDGPLLPALRTAIADKATQTATLTRLAGEMYRARPPAKRRGRSLGLGPQQTPEPGRWAINGRAAAAEWVPLPGRQEFRLAEVPAATSAFIAAATTGPISSIPASATARAASCNCAAPSAI